ncbi:MAG: hypothetical protein NZ951_00275 [Dehalococcoidia bacterium]|nr:hypothetical protein [Dehalococcoidia bacterium]MDW8119081.1 hypothetical protein [Chloroflexota bacterium]
MARITVTLEGEWDEVQAILARLAEGAAKETPAAVTVKEVSPPPPVKPAGEQRWTPQQVRRFWGRLSPDARRILKEVAKHPEGVGWTALQQALNMRAREIGGTLSSVGHRMRGFPGLPRPVEKVSLPEGPGYRLHPSVAEVIATLEG